MAINIKNMGNKTKVKVVALLAFVVLSSLYLWPSEDSELVDVSYGEAIEETLEQTYSSPQVFHETVVDDRENPVNVPKFNFIVELAKVIENVKNKPEAMLEYKYAISEQMLEKRAKIQELLAKEAESKLKELNAKKEMHNMQAGMLVSSSNTPTQDITSSMVTKALFEYNYQPSDFSLTNVKSTIDGLEAIVEFHGEFYSARKGKELLTMVTVLDVKHDRVELSTPSIPSFQVVLKL
jgi:hypothetical protein